MNKLKEFNPQRLKTRRQQLHLTQLDLAFKCATNGHRITPQTLMNWETGRCRPYPRMLAVVAEVLGVSLNHFYQ